MHRKTEYGRYGPEFARGPNDHEGYEYVISHNDGIEVDFVLASGSVPVNYEYTKLQVEDTNGSHRIKSANEKQKEEVSSLLLRKFVIFGTVAL